MKLKISQDAEASADRVFAGLTNFARYELALYERGVQLTRKGNWQQAEVGSAWAGKAELRGKLRRIEAEITSLEPERGLSIAAKIGGLHLEHQILLVPLGQSVTRINTVTDLKPDTLTARLLVQSLKLARGKVLGRMQDRLAREVARIEQGANPAA